MPPLDAAVSLDDRYRLSAGSALMNGMQALTRLVIEQADLDRDAGLKTRGYVTGYRGSPVGGFDAELMRAKAELEVRGILFHPAINEDLAMTAVGGTQQAPVHDDPDLDGVFAFWYGKGPGVDRSIDAIRHANVAGSSPKGGMVMLVGDDPSAKSSSIAHQSEQTLMAVNVPLLFPSSVHEYVSYGLHAVAMSRHSGLVTALKVVTDTADSSATVALDRLRPDFAPLPEADPGRFIHRGAPNFLEEERVVLTQRIPAALEYARLNRLNRAVVEPREKRLGLITCGRAHLDALAALRSLGLGAKDGIGVYKMGLIWPLEPEGLRDFCLGYDEVLVIEDKRAFVEPLLARVLYNIDGAPTISGKTIEGGAFLPETGELTPGLIADAVKARLAAVRGDPLPNAPAQSDAPPLGAPPPARTPWYCAGCPHNRSTKLPGGALAGGGIGCHTLSVLNDAHSHTIFTQMGGEGASWIGRAPFGRRKHMFQNLGDGTYVHSGILAVRAAVASGVNLTYKVLYNDAVAMTGGQSLDGGIKPWNIAAQLLAEGVREVAVVSDDAKATRASGPWIGAVSFHDRSEMLAVQARMQEISGVTAILYVQTCAAEKRRRRKRGAFPDPAKRVMINPLVCEGCGDCGLKSNCVAIKPLDTPFGLKREIDQTACNKDYSCLEGFCPSFVVVLGDGADPLAAKSGVLHEPPEGLPPAPIADAADYSALITGVGGAGVVTVAAILAMAARLEGRHALTLDQTGLAQKNGAVVSHLQIGDHPLDDRPARLAVGAGRALIGCDMLTAAGDAALALMDPDRAMAMLNGHVEPLARFARTPDARPQAPALKARIEKRLTADRVSAVDSAHLATRLVGDGMGANMVLVGAASQRGMLPVSPEAIEKAIRMNGVATKMNLAAFRWGRWLIADPTRIPDAPAEVELSQDERMDAYAEHLTGYQNAAWADRFRASLAPLEAAEEAHWPGRREVSALAAQALFQAMSYKDEYEVARLHRHPEFAARLKAQFAPGSKLRYSLAPPLFARRNRITGEPRKVLYGVWMGRVFGLLTRMKGLRGTAFDPFGHTAERRMERALIKETEAIITEVAQRLSPKTDPAARDAFSALTEVKGFGHIKQEAHNSAQPRWRAAMAHLREER